MTSLIELAEQGIIEKTGAKPKLPIKIEGVSSETLDVYRIPLKYLYYNDKNGRISTEMAKIQNALTPCNDLKDPHYNAKVQQMIENDNLNALKKTQKSISTSGQEVYGYVLSDGRVIDGNRRFTALRRIHEATGKTVYFEAVVLPFSFNNFTDRLKIKKLELALQMGIEERQDYDPVDLAVDIYQTTSGPNPLMSQVDYANQAHMRKTEVKKYYDGAVYMRKFFEFIGTSPNNYNIVKESKVWSLFYEMGKAMRRFGDSPDDQIRKNETMNSYFGVILSQMHVGVSGIAARTHMRQYNKKIIETPDNADFNDDISDAVDDLSDSLKDAEINSTQDLMRALTDENDTVSKIGETFEDYMRNARNSESVTKFIKSIKKDVKYYQDLNDDSGLVGSLHYNQISNGQLRELQAYMRDLNLLSKELFDKYGKEIK